ncbi:uncharacterized protein LOC144863912 [Branchiostoma floridae x Branchiostoma japonicum]
MQHPCVIFIVCLLFATRPVALRRFARSVPVLRHHGGPIVCDKDNYYSRTTRSCEPCLELCQPERGTQRECDLRCKGFSIPTVIVPTLYKEETTTQEKAALRQTFAVATTKQQDETHGSEESLPVETAVGFTIWQIAEVVAFGCIVAALAVMGYCNFQLRTQIKKLWMVQNPNFSPGPATFPPQQPPRVHVAGAPSPGVTTLSPVVNVNVGQQPRASPAQLPRERLSLPTMDTDGWRTAPSNVVPIHTTDTKPHVYSPQNDLVEEDRVADRQRARLETEIY